MNNLRCVKGFVFFAQIKTIYVCIHILYPFHTNSHSSVDTFSVFPLKRLVGEKEAGEAARSIPAPVGLSGGVEAILHGCFLNPFISVLL